jgi:hypothetical protein
MDLLRLNKNKSI